MAPQLRYAGDPRRPAEIKKYSAENFSPEDFPPDGFVLLGLMLGMLAMMIRLKWAALGSMLCTLVAISNSRGTEPEIKQAVSTLCVAGFALFQIYMMPIRAPAPDAAAAG